MNIFVLDQFPMLAAQYHSDTHVVKMVLETAQLLSTTHQLLTPLDKQPLTNIYQPTHINHPCSKWVRESKANYQWLYELFRHLAAEYTYRYYKDHKSWVTLRSALAEPPVNIPDKPLTPFVMAFGKHEGVAPDPKCDAVTNYRWYYITKRDINRWEHRRPMPAWYQELLENTWVTD